MNLLWTVAREHPAAEVAAHEFLLTFNDDDSAFAMRDWWNLQGYLLFEQWLEEEERLQ